MFNTLANIAQLRPNRSRRISSYDRTGGNADRIVIAAGETTDIAHIQGSGAIKHIWITIACADPMVRRNTLIRMYWDGEANPSVESPIGDFFGQGWGEKYNYSSLLMAASPQGGNALNCYFPMPFGDGARIEIENQCDVPIDSFYYYIDYEELESVGNDLGRFHAWWNREVTDPGPEGENEWATLGPQRNNPSDRDNYVFMEAEGHGHYVGVNYYVDCPSPIWYGEGDDMFLVDDDEWPGSLHGTGTEDYFCSSWCPKEPYCHPFFGYPRVNEGREGWLGRTHCYRYHIQDPIYFERSLRASIEHGHANDLTLDISSVAYWYQNEPHKPFPEMRPKEQRQNMPPIGPVEIHRWRDAWRKAQGGGKLWGNERNED